VLGVIGGSGLYRIPEVTVESEVEVPTPFGRTSGPVVKGRIGSTPLFFIPRHGPRHVLSPSEVPYRANVFALKQLGVTCLLSVSAVGSLKEEIAPGHLVVPDQVIDWTRGVRPMSFFGSGMVMHVAMADPYCAAWRRAVLGSARSSGSTVHDGGALVCIEGPAFSTRAESFLFRSFKADLVGMTVMPEAKLAREASMCYATLALATDYDCWHPHHDSVTVDAVLDVMQRNQEKARQTIVHLAANMPSTLECGCKDALRFALVTAPGAVPAERSKELACLLPQDGATD
jgi:5'-methylthioadenosine phosphorylase